MKRNPKKVYSETSLIGKADSRRSKGWMSTKKARDEPGANDDVQTSLQKEKVLNDQQRDHTTREPFKTLLEGNWKDLEHLLKTNPDLVDERDSVKANVIHLAYLYFKYDIGRKLVEMFPEKAVNGYGEHLLAELHYRPDPSRPEEESLYLGENLLHITIVRRNAEETRWLLDFYRDRSHSIPFGLLALLTGNARGSFFGSDMMFGGYPLHFATCSNDPDIFDIILTFSEGIRLDGFYKESIQARQIPGLLTIFQLDGHGNNVLHLCAKYNLQNMYSHIIKCARGIIGHELRQALLNHCSNETDGTEGIEVGGHAVAVTKNMNKHKSVRFRENPSQNKHEEEVILEVLPLFQQGLENLAGFPPRESVVYVPRSSLKVHAWLEKDVTHPWLESIISVLLRERLLWVLNSDLQTPLTLGAASIAMRKDFMSAKEKTERVAMVEFLILQHKETRWSYGPITNSLLRLEGIEIPYDPRRFGLSNRTLAQRGRMHSVIEWLCIADCEQGLALPIIKNIVQTKWRRVGRQEFHRICCFHVITTLLVTLLSLYPGELPDIKHVKSSTQTAVVTFAYPITVACVLAFMLFGLWRTRPWKVRTLWSSARGAGAFEIYLRTVYMAAFLVLILLQVLRQLGVLGVGERSLRVARIVTICLCVCICWLYVFYFFLGHSRTAPFLITLYRIASRDIPYFLQFYLVLLVSFGTPLAVLTSMDTDSSGWDEDSNHSGATALQHLLHVIWQLIHETVQDGQNGYNGLSSIRVDSDLDWLYDLVHTGFFFCITITMLNLLIGMISNTYQSYTTRGEGLVLMERYNIMTGIFCTYARTDHLREQYCYRAEETIIVQNTETQEPDLVALPCYHFQYQENNVAWLNNAERDGSKSGLAKKVCLFILDPQNDFHDMRLCPILGPELAVGSLAVPGACEDSLRIAEMIATHTDAIDEIVVTLDSHHPCHISHAVYWRNPAGQEPPPFTEISIDDVKDDSNWKWRPYVKENLAWAKHYLTQLSLKSQRKHCIWPVHCLVGSRGHSVAAPIAAALKLWEAKTHRSVAYVMKGFNTKVEFYSAFQAEVKDPQDPGTGFNYDLLNRLKLNDLVLVCGQAMSHTVNYTLQDLTHHWPGDKKRLVLLKDGCSSVAGFERESEMFMSKMEDAGVQVHTCKSVFNDVLCIKEGIYSTRLDGIKHCLPLPGGAGTAHALTTAKDNKQGCVDAELLYPETLKLLRESLTQLPAPIRTTRIRATAVPNPAAEGGAGGPATPAPNPRTPTHNNSNTGGGGGGPETNKTIGPLGGIPIDPRLRSTAMGTSVSSLPPVQQPPRRKVFKEMAISVNNTNNNNNNGGNNGSAAHGAGGASPTR